MTGAGRKKADEIIRFFAPCLINTDGVCGA